MSEEKRGRGRPKGAWTPDKVRARIRTGVLVKRLKDHALGKVEMSQTQVAAAKILLSKVIPDMRAVEHSGTVTHRYEDAVLGLINGSTAQARDTASAEPVTH